ncbi:MAG: EamA family transporter [Methanocorpusculum sp.]|uniref:DMT family transporter n=1 Tax=Methanocorpusculum sp. TaxID=2058474 RepID=UPI002717D24B|nr:EamA family transporter [Methanocorpusculum sp.]MDO9522357.1 EamA family transporter [Methanocorpusculum sp.]
MSIKYAVHSVSETRLASFLIILAAIFWGTIGIFTRELLASGFTTVQITGARCAVTAICLVGCLLVLDREKLKINLKDLWMFIGTGILSIVFFNICYFTSIQYLTLSMASVLLYTAPFFVMLMSLFLFHERMTVQKGLALILAFGGCVLTAGIVGGDIGTITAVGILVGLGSGFGYALYTIFGRVALKKYHPLTITTYTFVVAAVGILPFCNVAEMVGLSVENPGVLPYILILGILCTVLPYFLYTKGLKHVEGGKASVMAFVEPMVATLIGIFLFHEQMTLLNMTGVILIFAAIVLLNRRSRSSVAPEVPRLS